MNGFMGARSVEARALLRLEPFIQEKSDGGRFVRTDKGRLAPFIQETIGDYMVNCSDQIFSIEIKAEERFTGNLFLETWSNRNLDDPASHAMRGSNPGWLLKLRSDLLFYYFLDADRLYVINTLSLKRWAFGHKGSVAHLYEGDLDGSAMFREVAQSKYQQLNDTWGRLVPLERLTRQMSTPPKLIHLKQFDMFQEQPF
jgi:hypothetical protein